MTPSRFRRAWLHRLACLVAAATLFLIFAGGLVTSTGSGLAVPDWPLSYGEFFPPMVGGIFYEHGHRMIAGGVAILTLVLALALWRWEPRRWVRGLGFAALGAVLAQAVLGGMTVLFLLPTPVSVAHACLAQTFFCLTVSLALVTSESWAAGNLHAPSQSSGAEGGLALHSLGMLTTAAIFAQLGLGAWMRHSGAGLAIPTFPWAFDRIIPPFASAGIALNFAHRIGAVVVTALAAWTIARVLSRHRADRALRFPAVLLGLLVPVQILLGAYAIWTAKAVTPTTAHVTTGAAILGVSLLLTLQAARRRSPRTAPAGRQAQEFDAAREAPAGAVRGAAN